MSTRITHPSLAELWRVLVACLERGAGAQEAPVLARSLAIAGLTGRHARAFGVRVERRGDDVLITYPDPSDFRSRPQARSGATCRPLAAHRTRMLAAR